MKFTKEQELYVRARASKLTESTMWLVLLLTVVYFLGSELLPDEWSILATLTYWGGFFWMGWTEKARIKRIMAISVEEKEISGSST